MMKQARSVGGCESEALLRETGLGLRGSVENTASSDGIGNGVIAFIRS